MGFNINFVIAVLSGQNHLPFSPEFYDILDPVNLLREPKKEIIEAQQFIRDRYNYWKSHPKELREFYTWNGFTECEHKARSEWLDKYMEKCKEECYRCGKLTREDLCNQLGDYRAFEDWVATVLNEPEIISPKLDTPEKKLNSIKGVWDTLQESISE